MLQVGDALLDVIFDPEEADGTGLIIDGFPRTALQADFLKLLYDKLCALHLQHVDTPNEWRFPRPSFKVVPTYLHQGHQCTEQETCLEPDNSCKHATLQATA